LDQRNYFFFLVSGFFVDLGARSGLSGFVGCMFTPASSGGKDFLSWQSHEQW
jgi:hypothetical protein